MTDAREEAVARALEDDPFIDDLPLVGTTQQGMRCEHYARAAIAALSTLPTGEEALREQVEYLNDQCVEAQMRAHKWMQAHDKLKAGKPYDLPTPADLPDTIKALEEIEALCHTETRQRLLAICQRALLTTKPAQTTSPDTPPGSS